MILPCNCWWMRCERKIYHSLLMHFEAFWSILKRFEASELSDFIKNNVHLVCGRVFGQSRILIEIHVQFILNMFCMFDWIKFKETISMLKAFLLRCHSNAKSCVNSVYAHTRKKREQNQLNQPAHIDRVQFTWQNKINKNHQLKI